MTIYFANAGLIDLDVIRVMGVSVKTIDNPIGYFGTGLKFSIATLLRTGHKITLERGDRIYEFDVRTKPIRGEDFQRVYMNDEALPFTTDLGKNWEVWQAYRELHSNTLDEVGAISDKPIKGDTVIKVTGAPITQEYHNRNQIFVNETKPIAANDFLEIYQGRNRHVFYRGVRAGALPEEARFTYNILSKMTLTEDRTFASQWDVEWKLQALIPTLKNTGIFMDLLGSSDDWDQALNFTMCHSPSDEFLQAARANYANMSAPAAARDVVDRDTQDRGSFPPARLSDAEHDKFLSAFQHLPGLGCTLSPEDVEIVESLGPKTMAVYHLKNNQIYLAKSTLDYGDETVVATLYEEWLHKDYHYKDESRELQTFLFQRLTALTMGQEAPEPKDQRKRITDSEFPF